MAVTSVGNQVCRADAVQLQLYRQVSGHYCKCIIGGGGVAGRKLSEVMRRCLARLHADVGCERRQAMIGLSVSALLSENYRTTLRQSLEHTTTIHGY